MSREDRTNSVSVTGGTHVGGTIGAGKVDNHAKVRTGDVGAPQDRAPATVADLRAMIEAARGPILEALEDDAPEPSPVRERWKSVQSVLGALASSGAITAITDVVTSLFGSD